MSLNIATNAWSALTKKRIFVAITDPIRFIFCSVPGITVMAPLMAGFAHGRKESLNAL
jgi:hypothetical protein